MSGRVLHLLSQRPLLTGSGVTLDALVRHAEADGWEQAVVVGTPLDHPSPTVGELDDEQIHPLLFDTDPLAFPVPGMSDVMPYRSTRFSSMTSDQVNLYRQAFRTHIEEVIHRFRPDVIHSHHLWLMTAVVKDIAPQLPLITQCHATGLRQMELCPHLAAEVIHDVRRSDAFLTLHEGHTKTLCERLDVPSEAVNVVGAGYRDRLFHAQGRTSAPESLLYIGKYSAAKGLAQLLDTVDQLSCSHPDLVLHVAGSGAGEEAENLRMRMQAMTTVRLHGQLSQDELASLMREVQVVVLPSFYEGVPLVLVEAAASGCQVVATALPGVLNELAPHLGAAMKLVEPPAMASVDQPRAEALPDFVRRLTSAIEHSLDATAQPPPADLDLERFTWAAVYNRVQRVWRQCRGLPTRGTDRIGLS